jgi:hypothetical protein
VNAGEVRNEPGEQIEAHVVADRTVGHAVTQDLHRGEPGHAGGACISRLSRAATMSSVASTSCAVRVSANGGSGWCPRGA